MAAEDCTTQPPFRVSSEISSTVEQCAVSPLPRYTLPTVMFSVQTRITLYQSEYLQNASCVGQEQVQTFLSDLQSDVVEGVCGTSSTSPRATLRQMELDLIELIHGIPKAWSDTVKEDGDKMPPQCKNPKGNDKPWDNHDDVRQKISTFQTDHVAPIIQGIELYRAAASQYITLFGIVQQIFVAHANVSVSSEKAAGWGARPLITHFGEVRNRITTACSFDSIMNFVHATSKLVGDERGAATVFGSIKELDDLLQQFVENSNQPAFVWNECQTSKHSCDALKQKCDRMTNMQENFINYVSQAFDSHDCIIKPSLVVQQTETINLIGPAGYQKMAGGQWFYKNDLTYDGHCVHKDVDSSGSSSCDQSYCHLTCDHAVAEDDSPCKPHPEGCPPIVNRQHGDQTSNALWWTWVPHTLHYSCFLQFSVNAYVPPSPNPPPPPRPPPLPPYTYNPRMFVSFTCTSGDDASCASGSGVDATSASSQLCMGGFNNKAGINGTIMVIKNYSALASTELLVYDDPKDEWAKSNREVGIFQGDVSTSSYGAGVVTPFARVLDIGVLLRNTGSSNAWVIMPVAENPNDPGHLMGGGPSEMPPLASRVPDDPKLIRYNQRVRLQNAYNSSAYLTLNPGCTVLMGRATKFYLRPALGQSPHPPPPSPPPPPPSPSPAPMPPGGVSLGLGSLGDKHLVQLWDWANDTQYGALDLGSFHGAVDANPTAFRVFSLNGETLPAQPNDVCSAEDFYLPSSDGTLLFNSSAEACEAWATDYAHGALAFGQSLEHSCASTTVGTTNCTQTCCVKQQRFIDANTEVLGLFAPRASKDESVPKRFDAGQCKKPVDELVFLPAEKCSDTGRAWITPKGPSPPPSHVSASLDDSPPSCPGKYVYSNTSQAEEACLKMGCAGLADSESLKSRPNLCVDGYVSPWSNPPPGGQCSDDHCFYMDKQIDSCGEGTGFQKWDCPTPFSNLHGAYCKACPLCPKSPCGGCPDTPVPGPSPSPSTVAYPYSPGIDRTTGLSTWSTKLQIVRMALIYNEGNEAKVSDDQERGLTAGDLVGFYAESPDGSWLPFVLPEDGLHNCMVDAPGGYAPTSWFKLAHVRGDKPAAPPLAPPSPFPPQPSFPPPG